jgi:hypothetical protein
VIDWELEENGGFCFDRWDCLHRKEFRSSVEHVGRMTALFGISLLKKWVWETSCGGGQWEDDRNPFWKMCFCAEDDGLCFTVQRTTVYLLLCGGRRFMYYCVEDDG